MATSRPFAYNTGSTLPFTEQVGNVAVGVGQVSYDENYGGLKWWGGPDEDLGYVIAKPVPAGNQPNPIGIPAYVGFWRSPSKTELSFVNFTNGIFSTSFTTGNECKTYLNNNGYWTSYLGIITSGLIIELDANNSSSYPTSGTTVVNLKSPGTYNHTLTNSPYTVLNGVKCFDCNGASNTFIRVNGTGPTLPTTGYTYISWARVRTNSATWRTLYRTAPNDHPILVQIGTDNLGFYDNDSNSFIDSNYDVTSIEDVWVQYTVVGDNSSSIFYINGTQVGTTAYGAGGNRHDYWGSIPGQPFGYVANMYYYNRKLTLSEITQQYNFLSSRFI